MLDHEREAMGSDATTTAALRVYDKLHANIAPLVGPAGAESLLVRSARLAHGELADVSALAGAKGLRAGLADPAASTESAVALFGTFFALVATLIGERLTSQLLRSAWPTIELSGLGETIK